MKKLKVIALTLVMVFSMFNTNIFAADKEMRAAWISTVYNMDWPKTKNNATQQKKEYTELLDNLKNVGINTVVVQVRPKADALYKSDINPWSDVLTGTQGKDPGYDPLTFLVDEAHKRGMEFHAWFNPYRITTSGTDTSVLSADHPARKNPSWVLNAGSSLIYNPGMPEVRKHIVDTVAEVVKNYNIDGVHFDDYFYKGGVNDDEAYNKYGNGQDRGNWRRENVNTLLREVKASIKSIKSNVKFGVSPRGIWRNKGNDSTGSDTTGAESYSYDYADTRAWIRQGLVDYIVPQVYWTMGYSAADYSKLVSWWSNEVKGYGVDLYIGQGIYRKGVDGDLNVAGEIKQQINLNRKYSEIKGSMHFSARDIINNTQLQNDLKEMYTGSSTPETKPEPVIATKIVNTDNLNVRSGPGTSYSKIGSLSKGTKVEVLSENGGWTKINYSNTTGYVSSQYLSNVNSITVKNLQGDKRYHTAVAISNEGWKNGSNTVILTSANSVVDGVTATPLASVNDAPILLVDKNKVNDITKNEIKRLNPKNVIVVGGSAVVDDVVLNEVKSILPSSTVKRIGGLNRYETSLNIAKEISNTTSIKKIYVSSGIGEADALSIAAKAGVDKQPIILSPKDSLKDDTYNWLKSKNLEDAYFIGGDLVLSNSIITKVNSITSKNVSNNRIYGQNRQETNAKVIEKFYTNASYDSFIVTKSDPLVDALTAGPLGAKLNSPIVIVGNSVHATQKTVLNNKSTKLVYKVGGGINQSAFNNILDLLN